MCKRCKHEECLNLFGDFDCVIMCKKCARRETMNTDYCYYCDTKIAGKVLSINEEATCEKCYNRIVTQTELKWKSYKEDKDTEGGE